MGFPLPLLGKLLDVVFFKEIIAPLEVVDQHMLHQFLVHLAAVLAEVPMLGVCHHYHSSTKSLGKRKTFLRFFAVFS